MQPSQRQVRNLKEELQSELDEGVGYLLRNGAFTIEDYKLMVGQVMAYRHAIEAIERFLETPDFDDEEEADF